MPAPLAALRALLELRFPDAVPLPQRSALPLACGVPALDRAFPGGGLARGKLAVWTPGGGAVAILRAVCRTAAAAGERAAWIDASWTAPPDWPDRTLLVRPLAPQQATNALRCAELLLRCGGFGIVVLAGAEPGRTATVRLARAAREGGGAGVVISNAPLRAALAVTSRIHPDGYRWRQGVFGEPATPLDAAVEIHTRASGWSRSACCPLPVIAHELCLSLGSTQTSDTPDRRGARRRDAARPRRRRR